MRNAADSVEVGGLARFNGSSSAADTVLTAGVLRVHGNFTVQTAGNFSAAGTHRTVLNGGAAQTVGFANSGSGAGAGHLQVLHLAHTSGGGRFASNVQIHGSVILMGSATFGGGDETAKPTPGPIKLRASFAQQNNGTPNSFVASGSHTVLFVGSTSSLPVSMQNPSSSAGSHFQNVILAKI